MEHCITTSSYKKRQGTSGISGQLYETKLLTLALFRALHNDQIEDFYLGTNLAEAGAFDDVVLRYSSTDKKEKVIFVQAKHKDAKNNGGSATVNYRDIIDANVLTGNFSMGKYFESYLQIRYTFSANSENLIFRGNYEETDVEFLIYTNATIIFPGNDTYKIVNVSEDDLLYTSKQEKQPNNPKTAINVRETDKIIQSFRKISSMWHCEAVAAAIAMELISEDKIHESNVILSDTTVEDVISKYINSNLQSWKGKSSRNLCSLLIKTHRAAVYNSINEKNIKMLKCMIMRILETNKYPKLMLADSVHDELIRDFFSKTKFYIDQATERTVEEIVKKEIQNTYPNLAYLDLVFLKFHDDIQLWWLKRNIVEFLTKKCKIFDMIREYIAECPTEEKLHLICVDKIKKLDVSYNETAIESSECILKLNEVLGNINERVMHIFSRSFNLTCSKLLQFFESHSKSNFTFINTKQVELEQVFSNELRLKQRLLIIASSEIIRDENIGDILKSAEKIILVSEQEYFGKFKSVQDEQNSLTDLSEQCQEKILDAIINFQGKPTTLRSLLGEAPRELVNNEILSKIIDGMEIEISKPLSYSNDITKHYIERRFLLCAIKKDILTSQHFNIAFKENEISKTTNKQDIVLLCGDLELNMQQNRSSRKLSSLGMPQNNSTNKDNVAFENICTHYQDSNAHLLQEEQNNQFKWLQSHGELERIREYLDADGIEFTPKSITDIKNRVVILAGEPGMGKSTVLTGLAEKTKEHDPTFWILRINLLDISTILSEWAKATTVLNEKKNFNCLVKLIKYNSCGILKDIELMRYNSDGYLDNFESRLFHWYFNHGKIIFLVDGFDEISPYYTDVALMFLHHLKEKRNGKLWVATRSGNMQIKLENSLSTFSYGLKPFTIHDAKNFLLKFWKTIPSINDFNEIKFHIFANQLLVRLSQSIDNGHEQFVSIPLHIKMIAIIFQESFRIFHESNDEQLSATSLAVLGEHLDLVSLYNMFIDLKLQNILEEEKNRTDISKPENIRRSMTFRKKTINNHSLLSMAALFDESELMPLLDSQQFCLIKRLLEKVNRGREKGGIIYRIMDGKPIFIHQSFADYFAALFIWKKYETLNKHDDKFKFFVENFLVGNLIKKNKEQICKFMQMMAKQQLPKQNALASNGIILLEKIINSNTHFENDAAKSLLKVVEYSLNLETDTVRIDQVLLGMSHSESLKLLVLCTETGCTRLVNSVRMHLNSTDTLNTLIYHALMAGHFDIIHMLALSGANVTTINEMTGVFPLHLAAEKGSVRLVRFLLDRKSLVDVLNSDGFTPLYVASAKGHEEVVRMLLEIGANVHMSEDGFTPLYAASLNGHLNIVRLLLENGANIPDARINGKNNPLYVAAQFGHTEIVCFLLHRGAHINGIDSDTGLAPLHIASEQCHLEVVKLLLKNGANVNIQTSNDCIVPLHLVSKEGHAEVVDLLLTYGASVNAVTSAGLTPLYIAALNGHSLIVQSLLDMGANIDAQFDGFTSLCVASHYGYIEIVKALIEKGATIDFVVKYSGYTPLLIAVRMGHTRIVQLLLDNGANIGVTSADGRIASKLVLQQMAKPLRNILILLEKRRAMIEGSAIEQKWQEETRHQKIHYNGNARDNYFELDVQSNVNQFAMNRFENDEQMLYISSFDYDEETFTHRSTNRYWCRARILCSAGFLITFSVIPAFLYLIAVYEFFFNRS